MATDRTPEQLGKETGEVLGVAIANGLEPILMHLADAIAQVMVEQADIRDAVLVLSRRVEAQAEWIRATRDKLEAMGLDGAEF
jgi:hypothetical protein